MLWIFSVGCLVTAGGCLFYAWRLGWKVKQLSGALARKDKALIDAEEAFRTASRVAESFEKTAKKKDEALAAADEHIAAERARADRLAAALQASEDAVCDLKQARHALEENLIKERERAEHFREELEGLRAAGQTDGERAAREIANILAYNGTGEGQVEVSV